MLSFLIFIASLSALILIHEFGHFIAARRVGVKVEKFSLGFGPKLFGIKRGDTTYQLCAIIFGGYVKMAGDNPDESKGKSDEYLTQKPKDKAKIIVSGALLNYILGLILFCAALMLGRPDFSSTVGKVINGYPAEKAGILVNDKIVAVDGKNVKDWIKLVTLIQDKKGANVKIEVLRNKQILKFDVPTKIEAISTPKGKVEFSFIGIKQGHLKYGFKDAILKGTAGFLDDTLGYYKSLWLIINGKISFRRSVAGPIGIYYLTTDAASLGLGMLFYVLAVLNLSLSVINLMPFPILDGGHLVLIGIEKIRGKRLERNIEEFLERIGISLIAALAVFVICNDIVNFGIWENILKWVNNLKH